MKLRSETLKDFNEIAKVNYIAFSNWRQDSVHVHESEMPSLSRQKYMYDPDLSIVAEIDGKIVGHILLVPTDFMVLGEIIKGVLLGPICVLPKYQKTGIGAKLIRYGHNVAKDKGYEFSLLCGHPEYYPKFGYIQNTFSIGGTEIKVSIHTEKVDGFILKSFHSKNLKQVYEWQNNVRKNDSLAIMFSNDVMDFNTNSPEIDSLMIYYKNEPIGYVKRYRDNKESIKVLYCDEAFLGKILIYLSNSLGENKCLSISQPFEHFSKLCDDSRFVINDKRKTNAAFMICSLKENSIINNYCSELANDSIKPGVISYPPYLDMD